jgi:hypothetical protein
VPAIIDSAPGCVTTVDGAKPADDSADFIIQAAYENCAGIMTFGPGSTYGEEGAGAATSYLVLTWLGIVVMVVAIVAWMIYEDRQLRSHALRIGQRTLAVEPGGEPIRGDG